MQGGSNEPNEKGTALMRKDVQQFYRALELNPGATPVEIRGAYRQLIQRWHPDRFKSGSLMQSAAEELTKEINEAYDQLYKKQLYKKSLSRKESAPEPSPAAEPEAEEPDDAVEPAPEPVAKKRAVWHWRSVLRDPWVRAAMICALVLAGLALWPRNGAHRHFAVRWLADPSEAADPITTKIPEPTRSETRVRFVARPRILPDETLTPRASDSPKGLPPEASLRDESRFAGLAISSLRAPSATPFIPTLSHADRIVRAAEEALEVIEVGAPRARVLFLQGKPDDASAGVLRYGSSLVYLAGGFVRGWSEGLPKLRIRHWPALEAIPHLPFTLGSTRTEVLLAQGMPTQVSSFGYHYDASVVFFENDRVVSWIEGNMGLRGIFIRDLDLPGQRPGLQ